MSGFPYWKAHSICGNFEGIAQRNPPDRRARISWGRCAMDAARWLITELNQTDLLDKADVPEWKHARIRIATLVEKTVKRHLDRWPVRARICAESMERRSEGDDVRDSFSVRAYLEVSRLQFLTRHPISNQCRNHKLRNWQMTFRRNRKTLLHGKDQNRSFSGWQLALARIRRGQMRGRGEWRIKIEG